MGVILIKMLYLVALCLAALPATQRKGGWLKISFSFLYALLRLCLGIYIPIFYFLFSAVLSPESKWEAVSYLSCLVEAKIVLIPLAIWAWASFYMVEVLRTDKIKSWMTLGCFTGVLGSITSTATLFLTRERGLNINDPYWALGLLFPLLYIPIWYGYAAIKAYRITPFRFISAAFASTIQAAFWVWAIKRAFETYQALPETTPECYVVTASSHGYKWLVKAELIQQSNGTFLSSTIQLRRFRNFETLWMKSSPKSHRIFRKIYNFFGPKLARRIKHPFLASLSYLALKPFEYIAILVVAFLGHEQFDSARIRTSSRL